MSYEEKGTWVYLLATVGAFAGYVVVMLGRPASGFVAPMLWCIGIAIGASIVGRILLEIAKPSETHKGDARDREIHRFGEYVGGVVLGVCMVVPLGLAMVDAASFWIASAIYAALTLSTCVGTVLKIVAYRRGL
ncbi:hypothetical protein ACIBG8_30810 [Nonomuraea sp. NPDC050556]|uniref:hypothetical protein n=1 Tax=Nonomuraea sp. NPDC050556 TaxID=3364369 RepID=UPI0037B89001